MPLLCSAVLLVLLALSTLGQGSLQDRQTDCGLQVFSHLVRTSTQDNVVLSPYGVASVLAMTQLGAAGKTRRALTSALGFSLQGESSSTSQGSDSGPQAIYGPAASSLHWAQRYSAAHVLMLMLLACLFKVIIIWTSLVYCLLSFISVILNEVM